MQPLSIQAAYAALAASLLPVASVAMVECSQLITCCVSKGFVACACDHEALDGHPPPQAVPLYGKLLAGCDAVGPNRCAVGRQCPWNCNRKPKRFNPLQRMESLMPTTGGLPPWVGSIHQLLLG